MAVKRRVDERRAELDEEARAWLRGETPKGFFQFKPEAELREIWESYGDHDEFEWPEGTDQPQRRLT
jgi:hypothetical protein